jgi:hypothetical protein
MGWAILPKPGTEAGPCKNECKHRDCASSRADADSRCHHCGQPIGYGNPYYQTKAADGSGRLVHAECELKATEGEVAQ